MSTEFLGKHAHSSLPHTGEPNTYQENELGTVVYEINSTRKRHEYNAVDKSHRREAKKEKSDIKWSTLPNFNYPRRKQLQSILG